MVSKGCLLWKFHLSYDYTKLKPVNVGLLLDRLYKALYVVEGEISFSPQGCLGSHLYHNILLMNSELT